MYWQKSRVADFGFYSQRGHGDSVWVPPVTNSISAGKSLSFAFLICKMGVTIILTRKEFCKKEGRDLLQSP